MRAMDTGESLGLSFLQVPTITIRTHPRPSSSTTLSDFADSIVAARCANISAESVRTGTGFSYIEEERRGKLQNATDFLLEPLALTRAALTSSSLRVHLPFTLDFFTERLRSPQIVRPPSSSVVRGEQLVPVGNLGNDRQYLARKRVAEQNARRDKELDPTATDCVLPPVLPVVSTLSLARPWPCFVSSIPPNQGFIEGPLIAPFHRSPLARFTRPSSVRVFHPATAGVSSAATSSPKTLADLSLAAAGGVSPFILVEYSEQYPLLLHTPGMTTSISRYYRAMPRAAAAAAASSEVAPPEPNQLAVMGPFGTLRKLDSPFIPRVFGGNMVRLDSCITLLESALVRVPVFRHRIHETDFLAVVVLVGGSTGGVVLRPVEVAFVAGQQEPVTKLEAPSAGRTAQYLKARVQAECRRYFEQYRQLPPTEVVHAVFAGERKNIVTRYVQEFASALLSGGGFGPTDAATAAISGGPEMHAQFETHREGLRRLKARGIGKLAGMNVQRVQQYVREIDDQMQESAASSEALRPLYYACLELLKELQLTPWNLASDYHDVVNGKRGTTFAFSAIGDPSGGRGEGISYLRSNGTPGASSGEARGIAGDLRTKTKQELEIELARLGVAARQVAGMSRWAMLRYLAGLKGSTATTSAGGEKVPVYQRKQVQLERLNLHWRKQFHVLASAAPAPLVPAPARPAAPSPPVPTTQAAAAPVASGGPAAAVDQEEDLLEDLLLADLRGDSGELQPAKSGRSGDTKDSEKAELAAMRELLGGGRVQQASETQQEKSRMVRLKVVQTGVDRQTKAAYTKIVYIYGERNIEVYRRWKKLHFETREDEETPSLTAGVGGRGGTSRSWHEMVEEALRVHRRLSAELAEGRLTKADARSRRCRSCHWLGHDASFPGCPNSAILDEDQNVDDSLLDLEGEDLPLSKRPRIAGDEGDDPDHSP